MVACVRWMFSFCLVLSCVYPSVMADWVEPVESGVGQVRSAVASDGVDLYIFGGVEGAYEPSAAIARYSPATGLTHVDANALPSPNNGVAATWDGSRFILAGGDQGYGEPVLDVFSYVPGGTVVDLGVDLPEGRSDAIIFVEAGILYLVGGHTVSSGGWSDATEILAIDLDSGDAQGVGTFEWGTQAACGAWTGSDLFVFGVGATGQDIVRWRPGTAASLLPEALPATASDANRKQWGCAHNEDVVYLVQGARTLKVVRFDIASEAATPEAATTSHIMDVNGAAWAADRAYILCETCQSRLLRYEPGNHEPALSDFAPFQRSPNAWSPALTPVTFTVEATDEHGHVDKITIDFGDGASDVYADLDGGNYQRIDVSHVYNRSGPHIITVTVEDSDGVRVSKSVDVDVINIAPSAEFSWAPPQPRIGDIVTFQDESTDLDGMIAAWSWQVTDHGTHHGRGPAFAFHAVGDYSVQLTVTDDLGATDIREHRVSVAQAPLPEIHDQDSEIPGFAVIGGLLPLLALAWKRRSPA